MSFGKNIQFMRKMHGDMTQEELAEKMGVSRQTISKWEMDGAFPEMEKAITLSSLFNCSLDELLKVDMNSGNEAYSDIRVENVDGFSYVRYPVISEMPEEDAKNHILSFAEQMKIADPYIIGWDFPCVSQEQTNVFHMHGYCAACVVTKEIAEQCEYAVCQPKAKYAVITIKNPFANPFVLIPNAYKTLGRYIEVNGLEHKPQKEILECFEREYEKAGVSYMDVYISLC